MTSSITYKPLSSLQPIKLKYDYMYNEALNKTSAMYVGGIRIESIQAFDNFRDTVQNRGNCLVLTSSVGLDAIFKGTTNIQANTIPGTVLLQPNNSSTFFIARDVKTKRVTISNKPSFVHVRPIPNTSEVELLIDNEYLQIEQDYPYTVYLSEDSFTGPDALRQRFTYSYTGSACSFRVQTNTGMRYLAFNNDDILRATGTLLCNSILNNYIFTATEVTPRAQTLGFIPKTGIVAYFLSFEDRQNNKNVKIKQTQDITTNFLASFSVHEAITTGEANLNFANLRTNFTPEGVPVPVLSAGVTTAPPPTLGMGIYASSAAIIGGNSVLDEEGDKIVQEIGDDILLEDET